MEVVTHDERLTTVEADRALRPQESVRGRRRKVVDETAATVILQAWLGTRRREGTTARG